MINECLEIELFMNLLINYQFFYTPCFKNYLSPVFLKPWKNLEIQANKVTVVDNRAVSWS